MIEQPLRLGPPLDAPGYRLLHLLEPARPRRVAASPRAGLFAVATVCVGAFMGQLDASIVTVALPRMSTDLHAGVGAVEWVSLSYVLTLVALVVPIGAWADAIGRKSLYVGGFAVFTLASVACAFAPDLAVLCAFRVTQAVGAALMQANSVALIVAVTPSARLGRAVGIQAAAQAVGLAAGPAVGGLLLSVTSWRWLFLVNVPAGLIGLVTAALLLPRSRDLLPRRRLDPISLALFVPTIGATLLALSLAAGRGQQGQALAAAAMAGVLGVALVGQQRRSGSPLIDRRMSANPAYRRGLAAGFAGYAVLFGTLVVVPLFLTRSGLAGSARLGLDLSALPAGIGVVAPFAGRCADRAPAAVARIGLGVAALAVLLLGVTKPSGLALVGILGLLGCGLGAFIPANNRSLMLAAPPGLSGASAGLLNMVRGMGTAAGTALAVAAFTMSSTPRLGLGVAAALLGGVCVAALFAAPAHSPVEGLDTCPSAD